MNFRIIIDSFKKKLRETRPFLRTKIGSRLALLGILDFIVLFFAPAIHGFVGSALFGCVSSVYLVLIWRRYDSNTAIVPAVLLTVPMLLDMLIYSIAFSPDSGRVISVITAFLIAIPTMYLAAASRLMSFTETVSDGMYAYIGAGAVCVGAVVAAWILDIVVLVSWWILCIIAFLVVVGIFMGVVFSTAAYTASDGRRQARKKQDKAESQERKYAEYRPHKRDTMIYNLDDDDFIDIE